MFDWDLPLALETDLGGFLNSEIRNHFRDYAAVLLDHFEGRIKNWFTIYNPSGYCLPGYAGNAAPNVTQPQDGAYICVHNMLLSHAEAYQIFKEKFDSGDSKMGIILQFWVQIQYLVSYSTSLIKA